MKDFAYLITILASANVYLSLLNQPNPCRQRTIEHCVKCHGDGGVMLRGVPAEPVVPVEAGCAKREGGIADCETDIGQNVRLLELERVEIGWDGIVGSVLKV